MGLEPGAGGEAAGDAAGPVPAGPRDPDAVDGAQSRDGRLAGFAPGGEWDTCPPGPELAAVLAAVAGSQWRCPGADPGERIGVLRRLAAIESWAAAGKLGVIREMIRADDIPVVDRERARHGDLPGQWSDSLEHELSLALSCTVRSAGTIAFLAWDLGARLPGIAELLADGTLTYSKARLVSETFALLSDSDAATAEARLIPHLLAPAADGTVGKTYGQLANLAARIAAQVDPGLAERRRKDAVRERARVHMFREDSGAAGLSGRDLPPDQALAANANVNARAEEYRESGAFGSPQMDQLRATAYLDLLNGIAAWERIAYGQLIAEPTTPDDAGPSATPPPGGPGPGGPGPGGPGPGGPGPGGPGPGGPGPGDPGPGGGSPGDGDLDGGGCPDAGDGGGPDPGDRSQGSDGRAAPGRAFPPGEPGQQTPPAYRGQAGRGPRPTDLVLPLATLLGLAERPGESHGFGVLDPGLCRSLATLAAASPHTTVCLTVTDRDGIAIGHGCARPAGSRTPGRPPPSMSALPARLNLTVTVGRLSAMLAVPAMPVVPPGRVGWALAPPGAAASPQPRGGRGSPDGPDPPGDPAWCGIWTLTMPAGVELPVRLEPVPTDDCDHRHESRGYQPNDTLRHLIQVRDRQCTFPPCSRHASESDFEHAVPYHKGGRTCACNAGARSRACHRVKQTSGWKVTQPKPGWHRWETPSGRVYIQGPYRYPA